MITAFSLFALVILILSIVIHEVAHGLAALSQGDLTAKYEGRLTLNPIKHIDPVGSVLVPLMCLLLPGSIMFGWAKPVPYNPYNLRNGRMSELWVAFAGPLSNVVIALACGSFIRFYGAMLPSATLDILSIAVITNIVLAVFNLVPLPPLDGSKILLSLLLEKAPEIRGFFERYGLFATLFFIFFVWQYFTPVIFTIFSSITGIRIG